MKIQLGKIAVEQPSSTVDSIDSTTTLQSTGSAFAENWHRTGRNEAAAKTLPRKQEDKNFCPSVRSNWGREAFSSKSLRRSDLWWSKAYEPSSLPRI